MDRDKYTHRDRDFFGRRLHVVAAVLAALLLVPALGSVSADTDPPPVELSGLVQGTGTHFEVTDSDFLNVTLDSSETISLTLHSYPRQINIEFGPVSPAPSSQVTLNGLTPSTVFYKYEDYALVPTIVTTDASGSYSYVQDLSDWHIVRIQPEKSTKFIDDEDSLGDCVSIGTFLGTTCRLGRDVHDTIVMVSDFMTLDGNGYTVSSDFDGIVIQASGVTIQDLTVTGFPGGPYDMGIRAQGRRSRPLSVIRIDNVNITNKQYAIYTKNVNFVSISDGIISNNTYGLLFDEFTYNSTVHDNYISNNASEGVWLYSYNFGGNFYDNIIYGNKTGVHLGRIVQNNEFYDNTISSNSYSGLYASGYGFADNNRIYHNNFLENGFQNFNIQATNFINNDNIWNLDEPVGGNYWSNFDEPSEGCDNINDDSFCDQSKPIDPGWYYDHLPWTTQDGWLNQPPIADAGGPYQGDEGTAIPMGGASASDPDMDELTYSWTVDSVLCEFDDASVLNPRLSCSDNGSFIATIEVTDGIASVSSDAMVSIDNVAPKVGVVSVPIDPISINDQPVKGISAPFDDPGTADTHTCFVYYGDSNEPLEGTVADGTCTGPDQTYAIAGVYVVTVEVVDDDGGVGRATATSVVVIYDSEGGFVAGGGWIWSPQGACVWCQISPEAMAPFGFVSKYKKGDKAPTGNTWFIFAAGGLNFRSNVYDWLVVSQGGKTAQFKGSGTINNGIGEYQFMLWAGDGTGDTGEDTLRIKIWYEDEGGEVLVYDNGFDQAIGAGNIKVHSG